ncbi:unnamed protein product [Haemonchus placei]|uniref:ANK_REP_REGION domain-containing protein n=1 Tax=Haemonchus placei TaxID=6290 RepID=A0A158QL96_HAEPC|nr:unnamed protein product [Haemonchus placei]
MINHKLKQLQEFFEACRRGDIEKVKNYIAGKKSKKPRTPLKALIESDRLLTSARDKRGCVPLHLGAWNGHFEVAKLLAESDPDSVDAVNNAQESSLHLAAQHGHDKLVRVLLEHHADPRLRNARFETPLDVAARTGHAVVCKILIGFCPELALQSAVDCSSTGENGRVRPQVVYPLHAAARHSHIQCLQILRLGGFDIDFVTDEGSALHVAAIFGQVDAVRYLTDEGINPHMRDSKGRTALEVLREHEQHRTSDLTYIIQSREGWSECRKIIDGTTFLRRRQRLTMHRYDDPMTPEKVPYAERGIARFPITSPMNKTRHQKSKRTSDTLPVNFSGVRTGGVQQRGSILPSDPQNCIYRAPPVYDVWHQKFVQSDGITHTYNPAFPYDNIPKNLLTYDNAPPGHSHVRLFYSREMSVFSLLPLKFAVFFFQGLLKRSVIAASPDTLSNATPTGRAPLAMPEELTGSTSTSILSSSVSPERDAVSRLVSSNNSGANSSTPQAIDDILSSFGGAVCRESVFAANYEPQVAVFLRDRRSQALTLQLTSPPSATRLSSSTASSSSYKLDPDCVNMSHWLCTEVGLSSQKASEVGRTLTKAGFDKTTQLEGCLTARELTALGIEKSIQQQILSYLATTTDTRPNANNFNYVSDWLCSLELTDYLGNFVTAGLKSMLIVRTADLTRDHLEKMGITLPGHIARILHSLMEAKIEEACQRSERLREMRLAVTSATPTSSILKETSSEESTSAFECADISGNEAVKRDLIHGHASFSAHYLGSMEISNIDGTEESRRAMARLKKSIREIAKVPQVFLEISIHGVRILDGKNGQLAVEHEISHIQIVCQDERDLNCFTYISQDAEKNLCHVFCVLTADVATEIIVTLGQAFELAYKLQNGAALEEIADV